MTYEYKAELIRVVDGDTIRLRLYKDVDVGFYITQTTSAEMNFRLMRVDTPEVRGIEKEAGLVVKAYVEEYLNNAVSLRAVTYKPDKYGRWLVELYVTTPDGEINLSDHLVETGRATIYK